VKGGGNTDSRIAASLPLILASVAGPALAQELPYDIKLCGVQEVTVIDRARDIVITHYVTRGIVDSFLPNHPFDKLSYECRGLTHSSKEGGELATRCTFLDAEGHKALGYGVGPPKEWRWTFLGGTGKFEGISGGGTATPFAAYPKLSPTIGAGCNRATGTYSLKK